jgi:hypothetical protein
MITKEILEKDLKLVVEKIGKIPTMSEYDDFGEFAKMTIVRRYGSWTKALLETFPEYKQPEKSKKTECSYCGIGISVHPRKIKIKNYCSTSCSNKDMPKRTKLARPKCETCEKHTERRDSKYCKECNINNKCLFSLTTMKEIKNKKNDANRYSRVRANARLVMKKNKIEKKCKNCQYEKHVQVCHIKNICDFLDSDTVEYVNSIDNLIYLCPNCHWEFDHGLLRL